MAEDGSDVLAWGAVEGVCAVFVLTIVWRGLVTQYRNMTQPPPRPTKRQ